MLPPRCTRRSACVPLYVALILLTTGCVERAPDPAAAVAQSMSNLTVPAGFVGETFVAGLASPVAMEFAPDGRLFICEQGGTLRVVKNGALLAAPFASLSVDFVGERGLLGVAFDPAFATNGFVYVYYTAPAPVAHNRLSRFVAAGDVAAGGETVLLDLDPLSTATNHNGGALHFGKDGKLYVAVGENATGSNAQTTSNLLGKLLRLNADGSIPTDNPFFGSASGINRAIWVLGLRNPFTFAVQPGTGAVFINDVGENAWEEINLGVAGANYGWPSTEGATADVRFRAPLFAYGHGTGTTTGCAITGGTFYNPGTVQFPSSYVGQYFFADYCGHWIRAFDQDTATVTDFASAAPAPVDLDVGPDGALYYLAHADGTVGRIRASTSQAPQITSQPQNQRVAVGQPATFSVTAAGAAPLAYQWQRNSTNIAGASDPTYTIAAVVAGDSGATFRLVVSNAFGTAQSATATLTAVPGSAPVGTITAPTAGTTYAGGQTVTYAGDATDPEDGTLPASTFTWEVVFHHDAHTHPFIPPTSGAIGGSFVVPNRGEVSTNVFYRIQLTVTDSTGIASTTFRDIVPRTTTLTLQTAPAGLQVTVDGQPTATPASVPSVVGSIRALGVVSPQVGSGISYAFSSWSDGGAATHEITTPATATTYIATFAGAGNVIPPGGGTVSGTTSGQSTSAGTCAGASASAPEVVFTWTPNVSGTATLHTCNAQVRFDTVIYVSSAATASPELACNDDTAGCATGDGSSNAGHHGSRVSLSVVAGRTYYVFVDGYAGSVGGSQGAFTLTAVAPVPPADAGSPPPPPPDPGTPPADAGAPPPAPADAGAAYPVVPAAGGTVSGHTSGSSARSGSCAGASSAAAPEQIFQWTPTHSGRATADTCNPQVAFDTVLYARSAVTGGSELACNDDTPGCATGDGSLYASQHGSRISFDVVAGQTTYLVVDGYSGSTGGFQGAFVLTVTPPP
jgi:glucose/arabinose dehydrogenase